jgi:hypothetical protein
MEADVTQLQSKTAEKIARLRDRNGKGAHQ